METPAHFPRAVGATNSFMTAAYVVMGAVGYWKLGATFDQTQPVTSILPQVKSTPIFAVPDFHVLPQRVIVETVANLRPLVHFQVHKYPLCHGHSV